MPVGKGLSSLRLEASPLLSLLWQMQMLFMLYNVWCFRICESGKPTWSVSIRAEKNSLSIITASVGFWFYPTIKTARKGRTTSKWGNVLSLWVNLSLHACGQWVRNILCIALAEEIRHKKKCVKNGYTLRWCCFKVQKRSHVHTQRAITESQICPRDGRLASHEITKQIEAHRHFKWESFR